MFGLPYLVVSAERELREQAMKSPEETFLGARIWRHKKLLLVLGVIALLILVGQGA